MTTKFELPQLPGNQDKWLRVNANATGYIWDDINTNAGSDTRMYNIVAGIIVNTIQRSVYAGLLGQSTNEPTVLTPFHDSVVVKRINFYVLSNTCNEDLTFVLRKNGVDTAYSTIVPSGDTGEFVITVNETYAATDTFSVKATISNTATGQVNIESNGAQGNNSVNVLVQAANGSPLGVQSVTGDGVDNFDPFNPVIVQSAKKVKITVTSAQLLDLHNTPVQLIAAPGPGKAIQILNVVPQVEFNTTPYEWSNVTGGNTFGIVMYSLNASLQLIGLPLFQAALTTVFDPPIVVSCGILSSSNSAVQSISPTDTNGAITNIGKSSVVENDPIMFGSFAVPAGTSQLVNGDSDLVLNITYQEITL